MNLFLYAVIFIFCLWFVFFFSSHLLLFQCLGIFTLLWCSINSSILLGWLPVQYALRICIVCRCWRWACVCVCLFHSLAIICLFVCYLLSSFALFMNCCVLQPKRKLFTYLFHLAGALLATAVARSYMVFSPIFQLILFCFLIIWLTKREKKNLFCFIISICISCACSTKVYSFQLRDDSLLLFILSLI